MSRLPATMKSDKNSNDQSNLTNLAKSEVKFRERIVAAIAGLMKNPDLDPGLKIYLALGLLVVVVISLIVSICILHAIVHVFAQPTPFDPLFYLMTIGGLMALLIVMGFPVLSRASYVENRLRTRADFDEVIRARKQ